jgi:hypothetical protein
MYPPMARFMARENFTDLLNVKFNLLMSGKPALHLLAYPFASLAAAIFAFVLKKVGYDAAPGVKRASPGRSRPKSEVDVPGGKAAWAPAFPHDATTLGGNSGGPVLSIDRGAVRGLHVGGRSTMPGGGPTWFVENFALPGWSLRDDPLFLGIDLA